MAPMVTASLKTGAERWGYLPRLLLRAIRLSSDDPVPLSRLTAIDLPAPEAPPGSPGPRRPSNLLRASSPAKAKWNEARFYPAGDGAAKRHRACDIFVSFRKSNDHVIFAYLQFYLNSEAMLKESAQRPK